MSYCFVPHCTSDAKAKRADQPSLSFHQFPNQEERRKKWISAMPVDCHDQLDAVAVRSAMQKVIVTGIVTKVDHCSVLSANQSQTATRTLLSSQPTEPSQQEPLPSAVNLPSTVTAILLQLHGLTINTSIQKTLPSASLAIVAGYLVRVIDEHIDCEYCLENLERGRSENLVHGLITLQDRDGLRYPRENLIAVVAILQAFVEYALPHVRAESNIIELMRSTVLPHLLKCPALVYVATQARTKSTVKLCVTWSSQNL